MRPIANAQNTLMFPLNTLLGTEGGVRVLRVLADETDGALAIPDIADRTGLTVAGVWKAVQRLAESGIVVNTNAGRAQQYALCHKMPIAPILVSLFQTEGRQYSQLIKSLRRRIGRISPRPQSVWIEQFPAKPGDPLTLGLLQSSRNVSKFARQCRQVLTDIEQDFDITIEVSSYTKADVPDMDAKRVTLIAGELPPHGKPFKGKRSRRHPHQELDRRSLERCRILVSLIRKDMSLVRRARRHVERLLEKGQGAADHDLREWLRILESYSPHRLLRFLTSDSQHGTQLRQSCPFFAILNETEREHITELERTDNDSPAT